MTNRRGFLQRAAVLSIQATTPVSLTAVINAAAAASTTATALPSSYLLKMSKLIVDGFGLDNYFTLNTYSLFEDKTAFRGKLPKDTLDKLRLIMNEAHLDFLPGALDLLPAEKRSEELDDFAWELFYELGSKIAKLNSLLMQPENILKQAHARPEFIDDIKECDEKLPKNSVYCFDRQTIQHELVTTLQRLLTLCEAFARNRLQIDGQSFTAIDYFCYCAHRHHHPDDKLTLGISREEFIAATKDWMETTHLDVSGCRLGLYELPQDRVAALALRDYDFSSLSLDDPICIEIIEEAFGSVGSMLHFLERRKTVDTTINQWIDTALGRMYDSLTPVQIKAEHLDTSAVNLHVRVVAAGAKILQDALDQVRASFPDADIKVTHPNPETAETLKISYTDAAGAAATFTSALTAALDKARQQAETADLKSSPVPETDLKPR